MTRRERRKAWKIQKDAQWKALLIYLKVYGVDYFMTRRLQRDYCAVAFDNPYGGSY